jgi:phosphoribosyl-AMP cyclohydrolase
MTELEEGARLTLDFSKLAAVAETGARVLPVVLQDADSGDVLFIGYANEEALQASLQERIAVLWSTSRNELWRKGATSGDPSGSSRPGCYYRTVVDGTTLRG